MPEPVRDWGCGKLTARFNDGAPSACVRSSAPAAPAARLYLLFLQVIGIGDRRDEEAGRPATDQKRRSDRQSASAAVQIRFDWSSGTPSGTYAVITPSPLRLC